jgi:hypothetical protein
MHLFYHVLLITASIKLSALFFSEVSIQVLTDKVHGAAQAFLIIQNGASPGDSLSLMFQHVPF